MGSPSPSSVHSFSHAPPVVGDERIRGGEDVAAGAVVPFEAYRRHAREIPGELQDVLDASAPPAVHRLVVVADAAQVAFASREQPQPRVLDGIGVLELVDEDVAEPFLVVREHIVAVAKQLVAPQQQLGEIDDSTPVRSHISW